MKILIAVDGSPYTQAAARYVVRQRASFSSPLEIHLLHVQSPIPYPGAAADLAIAVAAGVVSVAWYDIYKITRRRRARH